MPDQVCANGLMLDTIPQDLLHLSSLERHLISYQIPFITLIVMRRYGGHYKVNGPPVNVPTKLGPCYRNVASSTTSITLVPY